MSSEAPDTFKGFVIVNPSIPEAWEPPTDDEPKGTVADCVIRHIWRPHPPPDFLIEDFAKYSRHVDEVWASLPPAPERPPSVPKAPRQPAADPEKIEKATRENKRIRDLWPAEFKDGFQSGRAGKAAERSAREFGGYPRGFHGWPLERRNAWFAGFNLGYTGRPRHD